MEAKANTDLESVLAAIIGDEEGSPRSGEPAWNELERRVAALGTDRIG